MMDLFAAETELKKRLIYPYKWGTKQNDRMDKETNFIYRSQTFETLLSEIEKRFGEKVNYNLMKNYSLNRWFAFRSARAVETIFCSVDGITAAKNKYDKLVDFEINGIKFDHKTSVCPKTEMPLEFLIQNKRKIILWLYKNQSREGRKHFKNRLFILLYNKQGEHWQLRSEVLWMKGIICSYINSFDASNLEKFNFNEEDIFSDIIWAVKD